MYKNNKKPKTFYYIVCHKDLNIVCRVSFNALLSVVMDGKKVSLSYMMDNGEDESVDFRFTREMQANTLYRSVTEMHTFYCCDTVQDAVASQFCRDLKGTLASLFNDKTSLGMFFTIVS